jgi:hypothetical protein
MRTVKRTTVVTTTITTTRVKRTADLKMPLKSDGTPNKVYKYPQYVKSDGTRDMTTKPGYKRVQNK